MYKRQVKYIACAICGALAGMGGAYLTTCYSSTYTDGIVAGRGFIALAAVIFGRWSAGGEMCIRDSASPGASCWRWWWAS